jgi:CrcB protein
MLKGFFLVGLGSFFGGGLRYLVSKWMEPVMWIGFSLGTLCVNVLGCFLIGFLSGVAWEEHYISQNTKLLLTTGFCGGFTTFSTFINESAGANPTRMIVYLIVSLSLGFLALYLGQVLAKHVAQ